MRKWLFVIWKWIPEPIQWFLKRYILLDKFMAGAAAIIQNEEGHVLTFYHTYRGDYPWGLPAGWLKKGENPESALKRELMEEAGFEIEIQNLMHVAYSEKRPHLTLMYRCRLLSDHFYPSDEVQAYAYQPIDTLEGILIYDQAEAMPQIKPKLKSFKSNPA